MVITFEKGWTPDYPLHKVPEGALYQCKNLRPFDEGLKPMPSRTQWSSTGTTDTILTATEYRMAQDGLYYVFLASATNLFVSVPATKVITDIGNLSNGGGRVRFARYGDWVLCTAPGTGGGNNTTVCKAAWTPTSFTALGGSPPGGSFIVVSNGHTIVGRLDSDKKKVQWSALEDNDGANACFDKSGQRSS